MTGAWRCSRCIGLAVALVLAPASAGWAQTPSATPGQPSKQLLDYAEVAKADIAVARAYLEAASAEMTGLAAQFNAHGEQVKQLRDTYNRDAAEADELRRTPPRNPVIGFSEYPQWSDITAQLPGAREVYAAKSLDPLAQLDSGLTRLESIPATAARMKRAFSENDARVGIDGTERAISNVIHNAVAILLEMYWWETRWQYQLLWLEYSRKVWNVAKSYAGEINAARDAYVAELELIDARCRALLNEQPNHSNAEYFAVCRQPANAASEEFDRRKTGVCMRANEEVAPYVAQIAARLQPVADRLKDAHSRVVEDARRVVERIERDQSGVKADAFAPVDELLKKSKIIDIDRSAGHDLAVVMYFPFGNARTDGHQCYDPGEQMRADLVARYPAVRLEFEPTTEVGFYVAFNQSGVVQGEAEARAADARP